MTSSLNLTAAKIRSLFLVTALVICPLFAAQNGNAQAVATATLTSGGMNSISITSNQTFTLTLAVTTNFISSGFTVFFQSNNGSGRFQLLSRVNNGPYPDPTTDDGSAFGGNAGILMPSNMFDLGYTNNGVVTTPAGTYTLLTLQVRGVNAVAGSSYTIFLDNRSIMTDRTGGGFNDVNMGGPNGPQFTVNVIPEPTTVGLAIIGGAALLVVAYRKQRARA